MWQVTNFMDTQMEFSTKRISSNHSSSKVQNEIWPKEHDTQGHCLHNQRNIGFS